MWHVVDGYDWPTISQLSRAWANAYELTLARQLAHEMSKANDSKQMPDAEIGTLYWEVTARGESNTARALGIREALTGHTVLGLRTRAGIPVKPDGASMACRIRVDESGILAQLSASNESATGWTATGKTTIPLNDKDGKALSADQLLDSLAEKILSRVTEARVVQTRSSKGKPSYQIRIHNVSPFILNGIGMTGTSNDGKDARLTALAGFTIPPHKSHAFPASAEMIESVGLKTGIRLVAADLSAL
jgi:hypothetical protein